MRLLTSEVKPTPIQSPIPTPINNLIIFSTVTLYFCLIKESCFSILDLIFEELGFVVDANQSTI